MLMYLQSVINVEEKSVDCGTRSHGQAEVMQHNVLQIDHTVLHISF